ncbi:MULTISPECIES: hypothetical protein [unclassified Exiguobacterium]|uniref:hypothetical protein n=1 Tax=unclassified Exiguobacterium TaxID=2644629 RepID=UPI001BED021D|nr:MULTISPECIES: hypothetical protein [unclassified Exiguobacterium]
MLETIKKQSVLKAVRDNGEWTGYIAPDKVAAYQVNNGWCIGHQITITTLPDGRYAVVQFQTESFTLLEDFLDGYKHWNCNYNLGYRVRFWQEAEAA